MFPPQNRVYITDEQGILRIAERIPVQYAVFNRNLTTLDELTEGKFQKVNSYVYRYEEDGELATAPQDKVRVIPNYILERLIVALPL